MIKIHPHREHSVLPLERPTGGYFIGNAVAVYCKNSMEYLK